MSPCTRRAVLGAVLAAPSFSPSRLRAQGRYPEKPLRVFVPWTPGGATDIQMRTVCEIASRHLGQPIVVENRPGASGTLGPQALRDAKPDGYTLSQMPNSTFRMPALMRAAGMAPPFDPLAEFAWIIRMVGYMGGVVVRPDAPWRTMPELIDHARAHPGKVFYGTPGANTTDIVLRRVARQAGIDWTAVAFRGAAPNLQATLGRQIDFSAETSAWADMALEGRIRPLAVWTSQRAARFPGVPTLRELGYDYVAESSYGIAAPRGTPTEVVLAIHDAFKLAVHDPQHLAVLARFDMPVRYLDPEGYADDSRLVNAQEIETVRELGLRLGG
ncbi:tripartite tricarboxylate transporter substrate binding protein [Roseococcus sp. SYP-B2431]|uniref:tripartite tricarboxylate transporter substrate binding protein n=1 Tax=Roseococcus sp. SYP-B2431 TaxID=2496640 RepID=UPI00103E3E2E|nr:tripartite tricarboxylate transporter substrate binding protein [Roseococcus sp. SYP-B2431]TCI00493.1 tripartite tricarboxylate transporter substrate binding protein [Roseococcus sp. SYP-B2431]